MASNVVIEGIARTCAPIPEDVDAELRSFAEKHDISVEQAIRVAVVQMNWIERRTNQGWRFHCVTEIGLDIGPMDWPPIHVSTCQHEHESR